MRVFIISCGIVFTALFQFCFPVFNAGNADTLVRVAVMYAFLPLSIVVTCCLMTIRHLIAKVWPEIATTEWRHFHYSYI